MMSEEDIETARNDEAAEALQAREDELMLAVAEVPESDSIEGEL